jgi:hypothetical protein
MLFFVPEAVELDAIFGAARHPLPARFIRRPPILRDASPAANHEQGSMGRHVVRMQRRDTPAAAGRRRGRVRRAPLLRAAPTATSVSRSPAIAIALVLALACAGVSAVYLQGTVARLLSSSLIAVAALLALALGVNRLSTGRSLREERIELVMDAEALTLSRFAGAADRLVTFDAGFGLTLFAAASREHVALAITTPTSAVCIGAIVGRNDRRFANWLQRAVTLPSDDLRVACMFPNGDSLELTAADLASFIHHLLALDPDAFERCYLTDAQGAPIVLDGTLLRAGARTFDLTEPFEWRASEFQESAGVADARFQATWVRQDHEEIAFVSLQGAEERSSVHELLGSRQGDNDAELRRDARLGRALDGPAPPRESRVAVDRLFMLPLRRALDGAALPRVASAAGNATSP